MSQEQPKNKTDHLKPYQWKPGESGNPGGRPKGSGITARLHALLAKDDGAAAQEIAEAAINAAKGQDVRFFQAILDRVEGKVPDNVVSDNTTKIVIERREVENPNGDE